MDYKGSELSDLFEEYTDPLYFEGYTAQMRQEQPERYAHELREFQVSTMLTPNTF